MSTDCLFCKIVTGDIPAKLVYQNDHVIAFPDLHPQAPTHVLVIPKQHTACVAETADDQIFAHVMAGVRDMAKELGLTDYRLTVNNGAGAGQTVFHLHMHVLSGRKFTWPPG